MIPTNLHISKGIKFPSNAVTEKMAFLGRTGGGKTYAAMKLCEEMLKINSQIVALDPVGKWYGLQTLKNGKRGFAVPVFGGLHGDIPLNSTSGTLVADLIVDKHISAILDISQFETDREKARFATDFSARLFFRKKASPSPIHLFIEECQEFIPQNIMKGEEQMLHNFQRIWKLGRNFGIGGSLISQRPQEINKKALNQTECIFSFQMTGPQEKKAIEEWVGAKGFTQSESVKDLLPKLKNGECWLWSPVWLDVVKLIRVDEKETIDISATPKQGQKKIIPAKLSSSEIEKIKEAMIETVKQINDNDPALLKKRIHELEKLLKQKQITVKVPTKDNSEINNLKLQLVQAQKEIRQHEIRFTKISEYAEDIQNRNNKTLNLIRQETHHGVPYSMGGEDVKHIVPIKAGRNHIPVPITKIYSPKVFAPVRIEVSENGTLGKCERNILISLARRGKPSTKNQIAILSGYSLTSGSFNNSLSRLRTSQYIDGGANAIVITSYGLDVLGQYDPLPEGEELRKYWLSELGKAESAILNVLMNSYPNELTKDEIAEQCGYSITSGSFLNSLSKLRTLELAEGKTHIKASDYLFE